MEFTQSSRSARRRVDFTQVKHNQHIPKDFETVLAAMHYLLDVLGCRPCLPLEVAQYVQYRMPDNDSTTIPWNTVRTWAKELTRRKDRELDLRPAGHQVKGTWDYGAEDPLTKGDP